MKQSSPAQVNAAGEKTPPLPRAASQSASSAMPPDTRLAPPRLSRWRRPLQIAVGPILLFGLWYAAGALGLLNTRLIPTPGATLGRVLWAFALAAITGVPLGIIIGAYERVYRSIEFLIDFFRSMPATAMFP